MKKKVRLNNMEMFQKVVVYKGLTMQKVPGGWIYSDFSTEIWENTFVPYNKECGIEEYEVVN